MLPSKRRPPAAIGRVAPVDVLSPLSLSRGSAKLSVATLPVWRLLAFPATLRFSSDALCDGTKRMQ